MAGSLLFLIVERSGKAKRWAPTEGCSGQGGEARMGREPAGASELAASLQGKGYRMRDAADLDPLLDHEGDAHYVLLGEASHGTAEFYTWRAALSRRLILEKGFSFIAVEGDWPDCYRLNQFVQNRTTSGGSAREVLRAFERWPTWMWANEEVVRLAEWLRQHNKGRPEHRRVGFYGLDVYSLGDSLRGVADYLQQHRPSAEAAARRAFECFEPYGSSAEEYPRVTRWVDASCEDEVVALLTEVRRTVSLPGMEREASFDAEQ